MADEPVRPDLVVLDVNETLTDMSPVAREFSQLGLPPGAFPAWFAGVLRDGFALAAAGGYAEFGEIARHQLAVLLADRPDIDDPDDAVERVLAVLPTLQVHPDVPAGLQVLHDAGVQLVTLTNGATAMSEHALTAAGVAGLFAHRLSVREPRAWKPAAAAYAHALEVTGVPADRAALVAVHPWDVDGAARAGLTGAWLDRQGSAYPPYLRPPTVAGATLTEVAERLVGGR